jgi:DNA-binding GntR family transcriptional regulator
MALQFRNLNQLVYERIHDEILSGKLTPGTRLKQEELTERLGVSRTPIREALRRLESEGLIQFLRRNVATVSCIRRKQIEEIFDLRALLEGYAAEKASERLDKKTSQRLHQLIAEMDACHSKRQTGKLLRTNDEFHRLICSLADSDTLLQVLEQIWRDIRRLRFTYLVTSDGHEQSTREHKQLVAALESGDKEKIRMIVRQHAQGTLHGILETLKTSVGNENEHGAEASKSPSHP